MPLRLVELNLVRKEGTRRRLLPPRTEEPRPAVRTAGVDTGTGRGDVSHERAMRSEPRSVSVIDMRALPLRSTFLPRRTRAEHA